MRNRWLCPTYFVVHSSIIKSIHRRLVCEGAGWSWQRSIDYNWEIRPPEDWVDPGYPLPQIGWAPWAADDGWWQPQQPAADEVALPADDDAEVALSLIHI